MNQFERCPSFDRIVARGTMLRLCNHEVLKAPDGFMMSANPRQPQVGLGKAERAT